MLKGLSMDMIVKEYSEVVREIDAKIVIAKSGALLAGRDTPVVARAIWDTGASGSVISPLVAKELGLLPVGVKPMHTGNGTYEATAYVVDVMLPNQMLIRGVEVTESDLKICDALIGMDIISLGDMKLTNKPVTKFTFRIPAEGDVPM